MTVLSGPEAVFGDVLVRPARPGEEDVVLDLLAESVQAQIAAGEALLVEEGPRPIATLVVADEDSELWGTDAAPAFYVSRLAVVRRGEGLGYRLIDWVGATAAARGWHVADLAPCAVADQPLRADRRAQQLTQ